MLNWKNYTGREVIVMAGGISYSGTLVEMSENAVVLRSSAGFREIPMERVTSLELEDGGDGKGGFASPSPLGFS